MSRDSTNNPPKELDSTSLELKQAIESCDTPEMACSTLARMLRVSRNEIALLRLEKGILRFIYPAQFHDAGAIPLSGSSVAARTAVTRTPLLSNSFARVKHASLFEAVKLRTSDSSEEADPLPIQKIMSVPISAPGGKAVGVIQISRKGLDPTLAGVDFSMDDLKLLEQAAEVLARLPFMQVQAALPEASK